MTRTPQEEYTIVRYFFDDDKPNKIIKRGLTLQKAQEHCSREDTHAKPDKDGHRAWFDGYTDSRNV